MASSPCLLWSHILNHVAGHTPTHTHYQILLLLKVTHGWPSLSWLVRLHTPTHPHTPTHVCTCTLTSATVYFKWFRSRFLFVLHFPPCCQTTAPPRKVGSAWKVGALGCSSIYSLSLDPPPPPPPPHTHTHTQSQCVPLSPLNLVCGSY